MATVVIRRRKLVNPARRRLTLAQRLAGFGGKRSQAAAMSAPRHAQKRRAAKGQGSKKTINWRAREAYWKAVSPRKKNAGPRSIRRTVQRIKHQRAATPAYIRRSVHDLRATYKRKNSAHRKRTRPARRNVSAIITAGLPFANPARKRKRTTMAKSTQKKSYRRRRSTASYKPRRRRNAYGHFTHHRKHRRRTNPFPFARRRHYTKKQRRNPGRASATTSLLMKGLYVAGGAVGSRWLTQLALGASNTGIMGYGGNGIATLLLGWGAGKFIGRDARNMIMLGGAAGLVLRVIQDQTPLGKYFNLNGIDSGMGAIIPANFTQPAIYTGQNGNVRVPQGWAPQVVAPTPGQVVKSGMGAPVGRGHYSTGGGRGLYRAA